MPVINRDLSMEAAADRVKSKLTLVNIEELLEGVSTDRKYLLCTVLHAKKCIKAVTYFKINNAQRQKHETTFNRFVLLGVVGTDKVVAIFTYLQAESADLLRFCSALSPGNTCAVVRAKFDNKYMGTNSTTPIISTTEPLVPVKVNSLPNVDSPRAVSSPDFIHFKVTCTDLKLTNIDAVSPVCNGTFCDGQPKGDCPCLEIDNRKTSWVLTADIESNKLHHSATIRSKKLIELFAPKCKNADPDKPVFDVLDLSDCVTKCVDHINGKSGWNIFGWVKPTELALESTNYDFDLHVISICPVAPAEITSGYKFHFVVNY